MTSLANGDKVNVVTPTIKKPGKVRQQVPPGYRSCGPCHKAKTACCDVRPCRRCIRTRQVRLCVSGTIMGKLQPMSPCSLAIAVPETVRNTILHLHDRCSAENIADILTNPIRAANLAFIVAPLLSSSERMQMVQVMRTHIQLPAAANVATCLFMNDATGSSQITSISAQEQMMFPGPFIHIGVDVPTNSMNILMNDACVTLTGYKPIDLQQYVRNESVGSRSTDRCTLSMLWKLFDALYWEDIAHVFVNVVVRHQKYHRIPVRVTRKDTSTIPAICTWQALFKPNSELTAIVISFDVNENATPHHYKM